MKNHFNALFSQGKSINIDIASVTFITCSLLMMTGLAFADSDKSLPRLLHSADNYPLLADSRSDNWEYDKRRSPEQSDRRRESNSREKRRDQKDHRIEKEHRAGPHHQEQRQPRHQHSKPPVVTKPKPKAREHRDHRITREYTTESRHYTRPYPRYPRVKPPIAVYPRHHHPRDRMVVRPFRYTYPRHRHHSHNNHIWGLLTFTAITLMILDNLNDQQQREHELALYDATTTPLGETIYWREGNASGAVTTTREGTSDAGRYCREYQSEVTVGGNRETVYGTACQQPDGSWEIVQ